MAALPLRVASTCQFKAMEASCSCTSSCGFSTPSTLLIPQAPCFPHLNTRTRFYRLVPRMAPDEEKMTRRSPLDFPIEWERPGPGRRPDIFPQFTPMKPPLPQPLPADPPEEEEEEQPKPEEDPDPEEDPEKNPEE